MHPITHAAVIAAIRAELGSDPEARGYAGKTAAEVRALLVAPIVTPAPTEHRDVPISDVEGYLEARLILVRLGDWVEDAAAGTAKDAARTLLRIVSSPKLQTFKTKSDTGRANILALFDTLVAATGGIVTQQHRDELAAMTLAPAGEPATKASRWSALIEGIGGVTVPVDGGREEWPGPPNDPDEALIAEAMS